VIWATGLPHINSRTSHSKPPHIERLIPSARIQGHGDEYFRPGAFTISLCPSRSLVRLRPSRWLLRPTTRGAGPASRYRCLNPSMAGPLANLSYQPNLLTIGFRGCSNCGQSSIMLRSKTRTLQIYDKSYRLRPRRAASINRACSIREALAGFEVRPLCDDLLAIAQISDSNKLSRTGGSKKR